MLCCSVSRLVLIVLLNQETVDIGFATGIDAHMWLPVGTYLPDLLLHDIHVVPKPKFVHAGSANIT